MSRQWTNDQQLAIDKEGGNILVGAAAGSGKTAVLVERVIRKISEGGTVDRMLIVTFTIKAAREMRERIAAAIQKKLAENPGNRHLHRQAVLIQRAKICTIDSFYSSLVKTYFSLLGISPDFKIFDEAEYALLKREILTGILEESYSSASSNSDFMRFVNNFGSDKSDNGIIELLLSMNQRLESVPFAEKRLFQYLDSFDPAKNKGFLQSAFGRVAKEQLMGDLRYQINSYNRLLTALTDIPELYESVSALLHLDIEALNSAAAALTKDNWNGFVEAVKAFSFDTMRFPKKFNDEPLKFKTQQVRGELKGFVKQLKSRFTVTEEEFQSDLQKGYPIIKAMCDLLIKFDKVLAAEKPKISAYCFSDISKMALSLCVDENGSPTALAKELAAGYDEIMIDEYQDTNEIQDMIFTAVSDNSKKLFLVGDVKQSIYGFRFACPDIFVRRKDEGNPVSENLFPMLINLSKNFRSRAEVIDFVNLIFSPLMSRELGGVSYDDSERLYQGAVYPDGSGYDTEIHLIETLGAADEQPEEPEEDGEENEEEDELNTAEKEAIFVANKIGSMIASGYQVTDKATGQKRTVRAGDFAVLLRSIRNRGEIYRKALENADVNAYCEEGVSYFDAYEILTVLSVLRAIDNPYNDIPLIAAMRSPAFFFSADELAEIRLCAKDAPFYAAVRQAAEKENSKAGFFLRKLAYYKELSRQLPVYRLLSFIYSDTGLFSLFGGMDGGEARQNNLNQLIRHAKNYEAGGAKGVYGFISFIDKIMEDKNGNISGVNAMPSADSVFVSTIHKSKGLEYPVCFISGTASRFNKIDERAELLFHKDLGFGFQLTELSDGIRFTTLQRETIKNLMAKESAAEELRVLYVAMTRAKEKLIITGAVKDIDKLLDKAAISAEDLTAERIQSLNNYLDWILAALSLNCDPRSILDKKHELFSLNLHRFGSVQQIKRGENAENSAKKETLSLSEIKARLDFQYENEELAKQPVKLSVTELKGRTPDTVDAKELFRFDSFAVPQLDGREKLNAAEAGTALHRLMQFLPLKEYETQVLLSGEINRMTDCGILTPEETKAVNLQAVFSFVRSSLYREMLRSKNVVREYRFTVPVPLNMINDQATSEETVLVQGVVDCFFETENGLVLIDYKTDKTFGSDYKEKLVTKYRLQLDYYKYALKLLFGKEVIKTVIYSCSANEVIEL